MNFQEILKELNEGKCVRRTSWPMKDGYLKRMLGFNTVWKVLTVPAPNAGNYLFTVEDFEAIDWLVIDSYNAEDPDYEVNAESVVVQ